MQHSFSPAQARSEHIPRSRDRSYRASSVKSFPGSRFPVPRRSPRFQTKRLAANVCFALKLFWNGLHRPLL